MRHPLAAAARARFRRAILAFSFLPCAALSGALSTEARANDDAGMMAFVLGEGVRRAPARVIFSAPSYRQVSPYARSAIAPGPQAAYRKPPVRRQVAVRAHQPVKVAMRTIAQDLRPETPAPAAAPAARRAERPAIGRAHLSDRTLRAGDIVATTAGLRVFRGASQFPYRETDFDTLSRAGKVQNRAVLEALDRTMRRGEPARSQIALIAPKVAALRVGTAAPQVAAARPHADRPQTRSATAATPAKQPAARRVAQAYAPAVRSREPASAVRAIERALRQDGAFRADARPLRKIKPVAQWRRRDPPRAFGVSWAAAPVRTFAPTYVGFWR